MPDSMNDIPVSTTTFTSPTIGLIRMISDGRIKTMLVATSQIQSRMPNTFNINGLLTVIKPLNNIQTPIIMGIKIKESNG